MIVAEKTKLILQGLKVGQPYTETITIANIGNSEVTTTRVINQLIYVFSVFILQIIYKYRFSFSISDRYIGLSINFNKSSFGVFFKWLQRRK